ncbi:MAG: cell division protein SepF [Lachnospiraceae bacterium]|nr:cell division protein SepF [Lachnospiraceae bacterium]
MGFVNKFLNSMKLNDDYDDEEFEPDEEFDDLDYTEEPKTRKSAPVSRPKVESELALDDDDEPAEETSRKPVFRSKKPQPSVVSMKNRANMEVCLIKPTSISDSREIIDILLSGRAVVINMEGLNLDIAQRIVDFSSGACYSMNGNLQSISKYIFIITPSNIDLSGDFAGAFGGSDSLSVNI